jgi:hypothetical protein
MADLRGMVDSGALFTIHAAGQVPISRKDKQAVAIAMLQQDPNIELRAGGPGSGCRGDNCGRPSSSHGGAGHKGGKVTPGERKTIGRQATGRNREKPEDKRLAREAGQRVSQVDKHPHYGSFSYRGTYDRGSHFHSSTHRSTVEVRSKPYGGKSITEKTRGKFQTYQAKNASHAERLLKERYGINHKFDKEKEYQRKLLQDPLYPMVNTTPKPKKR